MAPSIYTFPYHLKRIDEGLLVDPRVVLEVKTIHGYLPVKFLVDSGADVTSLPLLPYADSFLFKKNPRKKVTIGGVEGRGVTAYPFSTKCRVGSFVFNLRFYFIESSIDPLLGRLDFWGVFSVHFDNKARQTVLLPLGSL